MPTIRTGMAASAAWRPIRRMPLSAASRLMYCVGTLRVDHLPYGGPRRERQERPVSRLAPQSAAMRNRLVGALPPDERDRLPLLCRPVTLPNEWTVLAPREQVRYT